MYISWCECCGYGMTVKLKKTKRCRYCRDGKPLKKSCTHNIPERRVRR